MPKGQWEGLVGRKVFAMQGVVSSRYHIEDLVSQDGSGAVYRATDLETGRGVTIRRFFPTGGAGAGFLQDEAEGYLHTVDTLKQVTHESLLQVLDGGVDPVDGIPYLVMSWEEGRSLSEHLAEEPLDAEATVAMIARGLEGLMALENMFGKEARWLEMETEAVLVTPGVPDFRFWICPFQWLGVADRDGGVRGLGYLAEHIMGWEGQMVPPGAAAGLGGWVAQAKKGGWPLEEAFAALIKVRSFWTGEELAPVIPDPVEAAPIPVPIPVPVPAPIPGPIPAGGGLVPGSIPLPGALIPSPAPKGRGPLVAGIVAACLGLGILVWALMAQPWLGDGPAKSPTAGAAPVGTADPDTRKLTPQELINEQVRRASEAMNNGSGGVVVIEDPVEFEGDLRVFTWEDGEALRNWVGTTVILEGTLLRVRDSRSGKTRYLEFQESTSANDVCGYFGKDNRFRKDLEALKKLEGKSIRCKGKVTIEVGTGRVVVDMQAPPMVVVD